MRTARWLRRWLVRQGNAREVAARHLELVQFTVEFTLNSEFRIPSDGEEISYID